MYYIYIYGKNIYIFFFANSVTYYMFITISLNNMYKLIIFIIINIF